MNGGRHIAIQKGMVGTQNVRERIKQLTREKPWLVLKALSTMSESDRKNLRWVVAMGKEA